MSWIKENKFLAGFTAATVVGAGALTFLTLQAKSAYDTAVTDFEAKSSELSRLQTAQPFPSADNVKKLEAQRKEFQQAITELQQKATKFEIPIEEISPQQFQDRLRQTVDSVSKQASEAQVALPENFSLGFERYLAEPPRQEAAPLLGRQLKAIEAVVLNMIQARVTKVNELKREELPEEKSGVAASEPAKGAKGKSDKTDKSIVEKHPFEVAFIADQGSMMKVLNGVVSSDKQFYIPRVITVKNEKETGPSRVDPTAALNDPSLGAVPAPNPDAAPPQPGVDPTTAAPAPPPTQVVSANPGQAANPYIVGQEKAEVTMRIEVVDFADTTTAAAK